MIRWCLSLKLLSSASYSALRSSNLLVLPSERTLRDYTHFIKAKPGFHPGIDEQLYREAKIDSIPEYQKYVCLVFDEVKVKEDLVYDKHSAELLGFVKIGDINDHFSKFKENDSTHLGQATSCHPHSDFYGIRHPLKLGIPVCLFSLYLCLCMVMNYTH